MSDENKIITKPLTSFDTVQAIAVVWEALGALREDLILEGTDSDDKQWDEVCTAMAWIEKALEDDSE
jgi:hypothetical protein